MPTEHQDKGGDNETIEPLEAAKTVETPGAVRKVEELLSPED